MDMNSSLSNSKRPRLMDQGIFEGLWGLTTRTIAVMGGRVQTQTLRVTESSLTRGGRTRLRTWKWGWT
jgi:hypothetical protein